MSAPTIEAGAALGPLRGEIYSLDRLAAHARELAAQHHLAPPSRPRVPLLAEFRHTRDDLIAAYREMDAAVHGRSDLAPAEEWLLDNFHVVQEQLREVVEDLPRGYLAELPHLAAGPLAGYPRVYALALDFIAHTDARLDRENLVHYVQSYQESAPLTMGELWAIAIMLRLGLAENLRRLARLELAAQAERTRADQWAERLISRVQRRPASGIVAVAELETSGEQLSDGFVVQLLKRLREQDLPMGAAFAWLDERLAERGTSSEEVIRHERQRQAVNQVTVGNCITSMRLITALDWENIVERVSLVERALRGDPAGAYAAMDSPSRDAYRHVIERVAMRSHTAEEEVARHAIALAQAAAEPRQRHVGYYLIDRGRARLEAEVGYRPSLPERGQRLVLRHATLFYLAAIALLFVLAIVPALLVGARVGASAGLLALTTLPVALPASEVAVSLVNLVVSWIFRPRVLAKLRLEQGIPDDLRTMVVVPTLLGSSAGVRRLVEDLEIRYLANQDPNLLFGLLTDFRDAPQEHMPADDELLRLAEECINDLQHRHPSGRFYLFQRRRRWNPKQDLAGAPRGSGCWMGWDRKRGKLEEFNDLLAGAEGTDFVVQRGDLSLLPTVRYVITLDTDTRLSRDVARRLVGTIAHPLNRPVLDAGRGRVVDGYGLIQPRVSTTLTSGGRSLFARIMTGNTGLDPYTTAISDVYQDLFGEGSYYGKAIYDVEAFRTALRGRIPPDHLLSHDLVEGLFVRVGLASDVELLDDHPSDYVVYARRQDRWVRGDWQQILWLLPRVPSVGGTRPNDISPIGRWKLFDNLRRSLLAPGILLLLLAGWTVLPGSPLVWEALALSAIGLPIFAHLTTSLIRGDAVAWTSYLRGFWADLRVNLLRVLITVVLLGDQALLMLGAIGVTLWRLLVSHRNMLFWETAADAERRALSGARGRAELWRRMWGGPALGALVAGLVAVARPGALPLAVPFALLWVMSPGVAAWISQTTRREPQHLGPADVRLLRLTARKTWRFFETFVTAGDHWLPPDNYQEDPKGVLARRTSPTNVGLYLLSTLAARDFAYLTLEELVGRLERTFDTLDQLERYRGHLYNWYDTSNLQPLPALYVSTVDSGNLVGHLVALVQGCRDVVREPLVGPRLLAALRDTVELVREDPPREPGAGRRITPETVPSPPYDEAALEAFVAALDRAEAQPPGDVAGWRALLDELLALAAPLVDPARVVPMPDSPTYETTSWSTRLVSLLRASRDELGALTRVAAVEGVPSLADLSPTVEPARSLLVRFEGICERAERLIAETDFGLLYDSNLRLFTIGFNVGTGQRDTSYYDLLASECRLASLVAIAWGSVPQSHWFRLGRQLARAGEKRALLSWSGTMFEYLMPMLVMRRYWRTLLDETYDAVVQAQIDYGTRHGIPWGISESAYNTLDLSLNYQYRAFGVPGLGLRPGLGDDLVVAPYATVLAALVAPRAAADNLRALAREGLAGRFGFYESIDYTPARVPPGRRSVVVRAFMAHHQGMSLVALDNALCGEPMVRRFHADARIRASELLLQERAPALADLYDVPPREEGRELAQQAEDLGPSEHAGRLDGPVPSTQLLSNGTFSTLVTAAGSGRSTFNGMAVTRWREDVTLDVGGTYVYVRNLTTDAVWSAGFQPTRVPGDEYRVTYTPEAARFRRRDGTIETLMEVVVSPECHAEVRRLTLANLGTEPVELDVTSYAEIALASAAADAAHPAFGNLFVETEFVPGVGALLCTRRLRSPDETPVWLAHVSVVDRRVGSPAPSPHAAGRVTSGRIGSPYHAPTEYETSRVGFVGRGRDPSAPVSLESGAHLSNTVGAVLDPAISLRRAVTLAPGARIVVSFTTLAAESREEAIELAQRFADPRGVARTFDLAWTDARVELRHLGLRGEQARRFQDLAAGLFFNDPALRAPPELIAQNGRGQSNLWPYGISGDRPILLVRVDDPNALTLVEDLLLAHEYWRLNALSVDLVLLNEDSTGYLQSLQDTLLAMVQSSPAQGHLDQPGGVFVRRADQIPPEDRVLLQAVARIVLVASNGSLARQLARISTVRRLPALPSPPASAALPPPDPLPWLERAFWNGLGGFTTDGREYVVDLAPGQTTPAPWVNVVANPSFGFVVSESGSGVTWQGNSQSNRLTPWSNDPVSDPAGEALYLRDEESGALWTPTPLPTPSGGTYRVRHGQGYTRFENVLGGLETELTLFAPADASVKVRRLRLRNRSDRVRRLSATLYAEWVVGTTREQAAAQVVTELDGETGAIFARNCYADPAARVAFAAASHPTAGYSGNRTEFLGRNGRRARPEALGRRGVLLPGAVGAGLDPCAALQVVVDLVPGEARDLVFLLGEAGDPAEARALIGKYRSPVGAEDALAAAIARWDALLGALQVHTPNAALDLVVNRWLLYQDLSCRFWGRTAFYQSSGAYGFRDQLQDVAAVFHVAPEIAREHILRAAGRQFREGDVQHWWHPDTGQGVRTRYSDDLLWLPYVTAAYVEATGDHAILDESIPFLESRELEPEEHDLFAVPKVSAETASVYEHCLRAFERGTTRGFHGLPLMGSGDWNDGMNRVGEGGRGESVWLAWFLARALLDFAPLCEARGDAARAEQLRAEARRLGQAVDAEAWDGAWYRRAYFDDGMPLGSRLNDECRIDAIAQSWAVIAGVGDPERRRTAMRSVEDKLVRGDDGLILLLTPPFDKAPLDPGYIKGYVPGVRENGGQYTHAAIWTVWAKALLGEGARAVELFDLLNPINHARTPDEVARYKVEPYVVAADVYAAPQHVGRGGWTWYTGSAGWLYRLAVEAILGFHLVGECFHVEPTIPPDWRRFELRYRHGATIYLVEVENPDGVSRGVRRVELDGIAREDGQVPLLCDGQEHRVRIVLGDTPKPTAAAGKP